MPESDIVCTVVVAVAIKFYTSIGSIITIIIVKHTYMYIHTHTHIATHTTSENDPERIETDAPLEESLNAAHPPPSKGITFMINLSFHSKIATL